MTSGSGGAAGRLGLLVWLPVWGVLMVGAGLVVTGPAAGWWPFAAEGAVGVWFAGRRTAVATAVSEWLTSAASTGAVIGVTGVCVVALVVLPRAPRWRDALFLGASVTAQSALFLLVTVCVDRSRPEVERLDPAPPTSSFPSGHAGASLALYGGLATLVVTRLRGPWRYVAAGLLLLVPPAVAVSRLYRGMHHPSDVVAGLVNGAVVLLVLAHALLLGRSPVSRGAYAPRRTRAVAPYAPAGWWGTGRGQGAFWYVDGRTGPPTEGKRRGTRDQRQGPQAVRGARPRPQRDPDPGRGDRRAADEGSVPGGVG
ncbi:phosphatase PAP2 family protein [Streptomyces ficellus]|uniref:Phosphatase PAP2 family protein n=1 Tax=Streptomyces ficellus TaxID=1977088 RepID=A0A6I6FR58_9ACTN|nr:phosphatase PAP2 family protein [Streptomyces ficellus]